MNYLQDITKLRNTYYILRHGMSLANQQEIIVSHPDDGVPAFGLVEQGRMQVTRAVEMAQNRFGLDATTLIVSSDFARARETAEIAASLLGVPTIIFSSSLRERYFGTWDKQSTNNYVNVWQDDVNYPDHKHHDVESTAEVLARVTALIQDLEHSHSDEDVLLVSHGDTLQILQTAFERVASSQHRSLPHLQTGEVRKLQIKARDGAA